MEWRIIRKFITTANVEYVVESMKGLDDATRARLSPEVTAFATQWKTELALNTSKRGGLWEFRRRRKTTTLREQSPTLWLAGIGCQTDIDNLEKWLTSVDFGDTSSLINHAVDILSVREKPWIEKLIIALGERADSPHSMGVQVALGLMNTVGVKVPESSVYLEAWLTSCLNRCGGTDPVALSRVIASSSLRDPMLNVLFEVTEYAQYLKSPWPKAIAALSATQVTTGDELISRCMKRILSGGSERLTGFIELYEALRPSVGVRMAQVADMVGLIAGGTRELGLFAQRQLRFLDEESLLDSSIVVEATLAALSHGDAAVAECQVEWLGEIIARSPSQTKDLLSIAISGLKHDSEHVQRSVIALLSTYSDHVSGSIAETIRFNSQELSKPVRDLLPVSFDVSISPPAVVRECDMVVPAAPVTPAVSHDTSATVSVLTSLDKLASDLTSMLETVGRVEPKTVWEATALDDILAGIVSAYRRDPVDVARVFSPIANAYPYPGPKTPGQNGYCIAADLRAFVAVVSDPSVNIESVSGEIPAGIVGPTRVLALRIREIITNLTDPSISALVSTPTHASGLIDPAVLVRRLTEAAANGVSPGEFDLQQALLRLPSSPNAALADTVAMIGSPACIRLATALRGETGPAIPHARHADTMGSPVSETERGSQLRTILLDVNDSNVADPVHGAGDVWSALWPTRPDIIASWLLPHAIKLATTSAKGGTGGLTHFGSVIDQKCAPIHHVAALVLSASDVADRDHAVSLLLAMNAQGHLDPELLGRHIGDLVTAGTIKLTRVVPALSQAANLGAGAAVWPVIAHALPLLLPRHDEKAVHRLSDLVTLGCETLDAAPGFVEIPELSLFAQRKASTKLVKEARRLHSMLSSVSSQ